MTKLDFSVLCVRLLALYTIATSFQLLDYIVNLSYPGSLPQVAGIVWLFYASPFILKVSFGIFLWIFAVSIGRYSIYSGHESEKISAWQSREVASAALGLLGAALLAFEIADVTSKIVNYAMFVGRGGRSPVTVTAIVLAHVPALCLGLALLFGARYWAYWLSPRERELVKTQFASDAEP